MELLPGRRTRSYRNRSCGDTRRYSEWVLRGSRSVYSSSKRRWNSEALDCGCFAIGRTMLRSRRKREPRRSLTEFVGEMNSGRAPSNAFAPAGVVLPLEFHRDGAVRIDRLFTRPSNRLFHAGSNLELRRQTDLAAVAVREQKRSLPQAAAMGMPCIEGSTQTDFSIWTFQVQPKHSRNSACSTVADAYDHFKSVIPLSLPDPGGPQAVSQTGPQALEPARIHLVVVRQIVRFGPQRPVIRPHVQNVEHVVLHDIDAGRVPFQFLGVVLAEVAILEDGRRPRWPVGQFVDLHRFLDDNAVRSHPRACPNRHVDHGAITDVTDVRLRVHRERRLLPCIELPRRHVYEGSLRGHVVGKRIGKIAGVSFAPEPVLHQVHPFNQWIAFKLCCQWIIQFSKCFLKFGMIVA